MLFYIYKMAITQLFNKASQGVKTLFKKNGLIQNTFNKGSQIFDKGIQKISGISANVGDLSRAVAPTLAAIDPRLGAAAYGLGTIASRVGSTASNLKQKKEELMNRVNPILAQKPQIQDMQMEPEINFA